MIAPRQHLMLFNILHFMQTIVYTTNDYYRQVI